MAYRRILFLLMSLSLAMSHSHAHAAGYSINGFLEANYSFNADGPNPDHGGLKWAEERVELKLEASHGDIRAYLKSDLAVDHIDSSIETEVREGYADISRGAWDLRLGRQIITWGTGDLLFINDVFPKDYEAFFSGRPLEYLKKGVDGARLGLYPEFMSFEIVVIPFFEPDNFPDAGRFWMYDPMPDITDRDEAEPSSGLENTEVAVRAYRAFNGIDAAFYFYKGFLREPSMAPADPLFASLDLIYPEVHVYGLSLQAAFLGGIAGIEAGYYDSVEDRSGSDPYIPNSEARLLVTYQRQMLEDLTIGLQYYVEHMEEYGGYKGSLMQGLPESPEFRAVASLRLTYLLMRQNLRLQWFSFWSPADRDYLLNPEARYNISDSLWAGLGAVIFGGETDTTQFGSLDENDNVYVQARYEF